MKLKTLAEFKQMAEEMFKANQNTRYSMKYRDDQITITLKVTDGTKTYTYDVTDKKEMNAVTQLNMSMLSFMTGRTKFTPV